MPITAGYQYRLVARVYAGAIRVSDCSFDQTRLPVLSVNIEMSGAQHVKPNLFSSTLVGPRLIDKDVNNMAEALMSAAFADNAIRAA